MTLSSWPQFTFAVCVGSDSYERSNGNQHLKNSQNGHTVKSVQLDADAQASLIAKQDDTKHHGPTRTAAVRGCKGVLVSSCLATSDA